MHLNNLETSKFQKLLVIPTLVGERLLFLSPMASRQSQIINRSSKCSANVTVTVCVSTLIVKARQNEFCLCLTRNFTHRLTYFCNNCPITDPQPKHHPVSLSPLSVYSSPVNALCPHLCMAAIDPLSPTGTLQFTPITWSLQTFLISTPLAG